MDKQKPIFKKLALGPFPATVANMLFKDPDAGGVYSEAGYKVADNAIPGTHCEHDMVLTLSQVGHNDNTGKDFHFRYVVSVEIKTTIRDILGSKVDQYLGATNYFFIAGPVHLLPAIICLRHKSHHAYEIGVVDSDTGQIVIWPERQKYDRARRRGVVACCALSAHRLPCKGDTEPYAIKRQMLEFAPHVAFVTVSGVLVNKDYLDIYAEELQNNFDLKRYA